MIFKDMSIRNAENSDKIQWDDFVGTQQNGLAYHLFAWKKAIEESYGFECPYFMAIREGRVVGIFPTVHVHPPFMKGTIVSLPYCDAGGLLTENYVVAEALFNHTCRYAHKFKIPKIEIRCVPDLHGKFSPFTFNNEISRTQYSKDGAFPKKVRMLLKLLENSEVLLDSFKSKLRSQVKKPIRDGLRAKLGGIDLLDDFYAVFAENMRDLGSPVHSKNWLRSVLKHYGNKAKCGVVYMSDQTPAAGGIILCHNRIVSIPWASSLQQYNRSNPNMLLYWTFLQFAADNGYQFFDFGRSTPGEGTYRFKAQWGAMPQDLHWTSWKLGKNSFHSCNTKGIKNMNARNRKIAENFIRTIPVAIATFLGSRIRKYISL